MTPALLNTADPDKPIQWLSIMEVQVAEIKKIEKYTTAFWILVVASIPSTFIAKFVFGTVALIITVIVFIVFAELAKRHYICSSCGNSVETSSNICPTCKEKFTSTNL
jgi:hypothetical protein